MQMNLKWTQTPLKTGFTSDFNGRKLTVIRRNAKEFHAYVDKVRLADSQTKREAVKKILEAIEIQGKLF